MPPRFTPAQLTPCKTCGKPKGPGRRSYCSDECHSAATQHRERNRQAARRTACAACGGVKGPGRRGDRFCTECQRLRADSLGMLFHEKHRRAHVRSVEAKIAAGVRIPRRTYDAPEGQKWCARCQDFRPLTSFPARKDNGKQSSYCKPCQKSYNRERSIRIKFGISWEEYEALLEAQGQGCAICGRKPRKLALAIDHDHTTGELRGLLCGSCNHRLLGAAREDPALLRRAADYLDAHGVVREVLGDSRFIPGWRTDAS